MKDGLSGGGPSRVWRRAAGIRKSVFDATLALLVVALTLGPVLAGAQTLAPLPQATGPYADVLDMHGLPKTPTDRSFNIFFDAGAWQGYSLPPSGDAVTGFVGPFIASLHNGEWADVHFAQVALATSAGIKAIPLRTVSGHAGPGYLQRTFAAPALTVTQTLFFADSETALVRIDLTSGTARSVVLTVDGVDTPGLASTFAAKRNGVVQTFPQSVSRLVTRLHASNDAAYRVTVGGGSYRMTLLRPLRLRPQHTVTVYLEQTLSGGPHAKAPTAVDFANTWKGDRARWSRYLQAASRAHLPGLANVVAQHVAVKAIETLVGNWRAPRGDLHYAGVVPSYSNPAFNACVWSWDSWKQAAGLALFAPRLAEDNLLEVFDYQRPNGMIPDMVCLDKRDDNWRNSKPPLATWAALRIYRANGDKAFLRRMYPMLVRYHDWWFANRDHLHDGLAEYGSTDGTAQAAKWESGMDDDARFDGIKMLKNGPDAWSMNQEAVDLNAYLYRDAKGLATMAGILGDRSARTRWLQRAARLKAKIDARFFDQALGYFFDVRIPDGGFVTTYGPAGWIPLWAGAATTRQAAAVAKVIADPHKFATYLPFPTLAADDPRFAPVKGYWRGPVWIDQAYFAIRGLQRYGHTGEADRLALRLVEHAQGLTGSAPIRENYDPLNGRGLNSRNFSWSAACYLMLLVSPAQPHR